MILDILFPKRCLNCQLIGKFICPSCQQKVLIWTTGICPMCRRLSSGGRTHLGCQSKYGLDGLIAIWHYRGVIKKVIKGLKYRFVRALGEEVIELGTKSVQDQSGRQFLAFRRFLKTRPVIIPIPLHVSRLRWRGFNQAEILAEKLALVWQLPLSVKLLERSKKTQPQVELSGKQRQQNIKGVFALNKSLRDRKEILSKRQFLIVDDVWTTGATIQEACTVLKKAGADKVWGLVLSR